MKMATSKNDTCCVSVIMPVYNEGKYIFDAISSILNQTFSDFEFIIIDDGSTDNSYDIIQTFSDHRIVTIRNEKNRGTFPVRNLGMSLSKGKYIAVMDADDMALPDRLQKQYDYLEKNPTVLAIGAQLHFIGTERKTEMPISYHEICAGLLHNSCIMHPTLFIRSEIIRQTGGYDEQYTYASDYDLACRLSLKGKIENLTDTCTAYRLHPEQISLAKRPEQQGYADVIRQKYHIAFINKHKSPELPEIGESETGHPLIGRVIGLYVMGACFNPSFRDEASRLLDIMITNVSTSLPLCIKKGLLGIGMGIMYLLRNHFTDGDEDEVLEDIDMAVSDSLVNFKDDSDYDWDGILDYLRKRALNPINTNYSARLKVAKSLLRLFDLSKKCKEKIFVENIMDINKLKNTEQELIHLEKENRNNKQSGNVWIY